MSTQATFDRTVLPIQEPKRPFYKGLDGAEAEIVDKDDDHVRCSGGRLDLGGMRRRLHVAKPLPPREVSVIKGENL